MRGSAAGLQGLVVRRLVIFAAALMVLAATGLGLLLFRWSGERGAPPAGRLYVAGDFDGDGTLLILEREREGNACYKVIDDEAAGGGGRVCRGRPLRVWVEDALLDLTVGARGVPRLSIAGLRATEGEWLGSLADVRRPHPRFPLRAQGVPGRAGRVVACPAGLCLEVADRLGRVAIARAAEVGVEVPDPGDLLALDRGDALWLGLVAFTVGLEGAGDRPALTLERVDRMRPRRGLGGTRAAALGGDRR